MGQAEVASRLQVAPSTIREWISKYEAEGSGAFGSHEHEEIGGAELENRRGRRKKDQTPRTELEKAQIEIEKLKRKLYMMEMGATC